MVLLRRLPAQALLLLLLLLLGRMVLLLAPLVVQVALWLVSGPVSGPVLRPVSRPVMALRRWVLPARLLPAPPRQPRQPLRPHSALLRLLALRLGLRRPLPLRRLRWLRRRALERLVHPRGF